MSFACAENEKAMGFTCAENEKAMCRFKYDPSDLQIITLAQGAFYPFSFTFFHFFLLLCSFTFVR
jgi:hypothetical protein